MDHTNAQTSYFVEGIQGAGKTTFVQRLADMGKEYQVFREGDFSPVEMAWCAYTTEKEYGEVLERYPALREEIREKTVAEGERKIICYTRILTDIPGFHKDLERYEIYNGNLDREAFERVIFSRFGRWSGQGQIFECSIFQNIVENQMLYLMMTDAEILEFYRNLKDILAGKTYRIIYLDVENIAEGIDIIRKERSDEEGRELWFPMMLQYLETSPFGKANALSGPEGLLEHLKRRRELEHRILEEVFREQSIVFPAKKYTREDIAALPGFAAGK